MDETIQYTVEVEGDQYTQQSFREQVVDVNGARIVGEAEVDE